MKVFVVIRGENYEGGSIMGIYKNKPSAELHALNIAHGLKSCDYVNVEEYNVNEQDVSNVERNGVSGKESRFEKNPGSVPDCEAEKNINHKEEDKYYEPMGMG